MSKLYRFRFVACACAVFTFSAVHHTSSVSAHDEEINEASIWASVSNVNKIVSKNGNVTNIFTKDFQVADHCKVKWLTRHEAVLHKWDNFSRIVERKGVFSVKSLLSSDALLDLNADSQRYWIGIGTRAELDEPAKWLVLKTNKSLPVDFYYQEPLTDVFDTSEMSCEAKEFAGPNVGLDYKACTTSYDVANLELNISHVPGGTESGLLSSMNALIAHCR